MAKDDGDRRALLSHTLRGDKFTGALAIMGILLCMGLGPVILIVRPQVHYVNSALHRSHPYCPCSSSWADGTPPAW